MKFGKFGKFEFSMLLLCVLPFLSACQSGSEQAASLPNLSKGHSLFLSHCVNCHQGLGNPPGPNLVVLESSKLTSETIFAQLLATPTSPMMPSFKGQLSADDVHELYSYLKSVKH